MRRGLLEHRLDVLNGEFIPSDIHYREGKINQLKKSLVDVDLNESAGLARFLGHLAQEYNVREDPHQTVGCSFPVGFSFYRALLRNYIFARCLPFADDQFWADLL